MDKDKSLLKVEHPELPAASPSVPNIASDSAACHCCSKVSEPQKLVKCRDSNCGSFYCRKCLTGQYKYSKKAARLLPTATWRCPQCTSKCMCKKYTNKRLIIRRCITAGKRANFLLRSETQKGAAMKREVARLIVDEQILAQQMEMPKKRPLLPETEMLPSPTTMAGKQQIELKPRQPIIKKKKITVLYHYEMDQAAQQNDMEFPLHLRPSEGQRNSTGCHSTENVQRSIPLLPSISSFVFAAADCSPYTQASPQVPLAYPTPTYSPFWMFNPAAMSVSSAGMGFSTCNPCLNGYAANFGAASASPATTQSNTGAFSAFKLPSLANTYGYQPSS